MSEQYIYTALIDVLGYRARLESDMRRGMSSMKDDLEGALSIFDTVNNAVFGVQAISDTVILTCNTHTNFEEFLGIIKLVFLSFLKRKLFIRGAIAYSKHFQSGRLTYSHAITRAYEIESTSAIYPRIIVDNNIVDMFRSGSNLPDIFGKGHLCHCNGTAFVNVVTSVSWNDAYQSARNMYERDRGDLQYNEVAFAKHVWFEEYLFSSSAVDPDAKRYVEQIEDL
ncbi:MAG: hypothetical protein U5S82_18245 [Gammaproteobacteria bacterium]|nr:hypothetical protein [Gammaproteobacteria bacterium]